MSRKDYQGADPVNPIDLPMDATPRDSLRHGAVNSGTTFGVKGTAENFGVNESSNIAEAERYDRKGYQIEGVNISTGRSKKTKYSGAY